MIVTKTPLRVSLFGGGTDFSEYYRSAPNGGAVIGFTLDKFVYVTARELPPFFDHKFRCVWSEIELVRNPAELRNPIYRVALAGWADCGLELHYDSDLPARSGLGSSSAFAAGLLLALSTLRGRRELSSIDLANHAVMLERDTLHEPGGHQDQVFAAYGGFNRIDFGSECTVRPLGDPSELLRHCLLFYTGQQRLANQLEGLKIERLDRNRERLDEIRASVDVAEKCLADERYDAVGHLLHVTWELKKCLAPGVSYMQLDGVYDAAINAGAWGGKLLGAGGGGFLLLMAAPEKHAAIRNALSGMLEIPVGWSPVGARVYALD